MSEQKTSFMEDLDQWSDANVISPLVYSDEDSDESFEDAQRKLDQVKQAIRAKVLESYRNGQQAGPRTAKQPQKGGR